MAHVRRHNGKWRVEVERNGVRRSAVRETKAAAMAWAVQVEAELIAIKRGAAPRKTLADALERYETEISTGKRGHEYERKRMAAFLRDFAALAGKQIADVTTTDLAVWRDARLKVVTRGSVQRDINLLSHVFSTARDEWKWIPESPFKGFRAPGDNPPRERRILPSEIRRIVRWLGYRTGERPRMKQQEAALAFLLSLRTGMRAGEVLSLGDANVDLARRVATVAHKTQHLTGRPRQVPLSRHAVRLLAPQLGRGPVFTITSASLDATFRKARAALLIEDLHFHDARANALTRFSRLVDVLELARISGHRDLGILLSAYYRVSPETIAGRLDAPKPSRRPPSTGASGG